MRRPAQLQINQSGAWRTVLNFDVTDLPPEFLTAAQDLVCLSGSDSRMRIVACLQGPSGAWAATNTVLMAWTRKEGWVNA